jgi:transcriptional regulator with XRE-family HTH domain
MPADQDFLKSLYDQARSIMKSRKWTQTDLADVVGTHQNQISRTLRGAVCPNIATLHAIAEALDCDLEITLKPRNKMISKVE